MISAQYMSTRRVLIIEDDPRIGKLVATELREASCTVDIRNNGIFGLACFERGGYDLVVLDLILPGIDGLEICRRIRQQSRFTPIVMLTAKAAMSDIVRGLELGADEYLTKPFATAELMARIQALFRRIAADREQADGADGKLVICQGSLIIDVRKHTVNLGDTTIGLTAKEFDLLQLFAGHPGRTFDRNELLNLIWGTAFKGYEHTVNTHINRLRNKIETDSSRPKFIETVWGVGYRFIEQSLG